MRDKKEGTHDDKADAEKGAKEQVLLIGKNRRYPRDHRNWRWLKTSNPEKSREESTL